MEPQMTVRRSANERLVILEQKVSHMKERLEKMSAKVDEMHARPPCSCGTMLDRARMATGVDPDRTALTTPLPPLNGTRTISAPCS
jgi:hypothetical protein